MIFTRIKEIQLPPNAEVGKGFTIIMITDGQVPWPQLIIRHADGWEWIVKEQQVIEAQPGYYHFQIPPNAYHAGTAHLQIEGCRTTKLHLAQAHDWIKVYDSIEIIGREKPPTSPPPNYPTFTIPTVTLTEMQQPVIYFGIHKHMHQPYYNATDLDYWDGEKENIFGQRANNYIRFLPAAVRQYIEGGLAHAGISTSWSGSLIEQLNRCAQTGRGFNAFTNWNHELRHLAQALTAFGNPRLDFTAFGHFHPLMALIPARDIIGQIQWHRQIIRDTFGIEASDILFPPETAFHPHMIPALKQANIHAVIYDSIHHFRTCKNYPYAGTAEGMLPPNLAEQINPPINDWLSLHGIWAPSKISPQLLKPCLLTYTDHAGQEHEIIGIPAERYLGNEDARGGYGALQYERVMGQIYDQLVKTNNYDSKHPPFFLLHSDGDNYGGGAESYYTCNTARLVQMCQNDPRFQLITIKDYLHRFAVDPHNKVHLEPGAWAGADNGDPQFTKWFSWAEKEYSPDLNSWSVLTALQNIVHTLEDAQLEATLLNQLKRLLYTAETSCYWYWTGQSLWDSQVTQATNKAVALAKSALDHLLQTKGDKTAPTIFTPWIRPANPGGQDWGQGGLVKAAKEAILRTFIYDLAGIKQVTLHYHHTHNELRQTMPMTNIGAYPSRTNSVVTAIQYQATLPAGIGDIRYFIEAVDKENNVAYSPVGRIYLA
jgi:hypothetical protein